MRIVLSLFILALIVGCSLFEDDEPKYTYSRASVEDVEILSMIDGRVSFLCQTTVGSPCHEFASTEVKRDGTEIEVRITARREWGQICPAVLASLEVPVTVVVERGHRYTFRFAQWEGTIDLEVTVP